MEKRVFVIGDRDTVLGFSLIGVEGMVTDDAGLAAEKLNDLARDPDIGIILVTSGIGNKMVATIERLKEAGALPIILEIPDRLTHPERMPLRELVRRALGISV